MNPIRYRLGKRVLRIQTMGLYEPQKSSPYDFFKDMLDPVVETAVAQCLQTGQGYILADRLDVLNRIHLEPVAPSDGPFYLFCSIYCEEDTDIVLRSTGYCFSLWLNSDKILMRQDMWEAFNVAKLKQGENVLIAEFPCLRDNHGLNRSLGLRISRYVDEMMDSPVTLLRDNYTIIDHAASVMSENQYISDSPIYSTVFLKDLRYSFVFLFNDRVDYPIDQEISVSFFDASTGECFAKTTCKPFIHHCYEFSQNVPALILAIFTYFDAQGNAHGRFANLILSGFENQEDAVVGEARRLLGDSNLTEQHKMALEFFLNQYDLFEGWKMIQQMTAVNLQDCLLQCQGKYLLEDNNIKRVYFRSRLDKTIEYYTLRLPDGYSASRRYPLIAIMNTNRYNHFSKYSGIFDGEPIIVVDVSSRGFTLGSYIGEAAIWEVIGLVKSHYSIDEDRIYFMGSSNGGYATWAQAQNYPHELAGIVPISGGVYPPNIRNLYNLRVLNVTSTSDDLYVEAYVHPKKELMKLKDYHGLLAEDMLHTDLILLNCKRQLIAAMLEVRREAWPREIRYRTERHAHRRAYWAEIHGIAFGKRYAAIQAIAQDDTILVRTANATGITLTVPPYMRSRQIRIVLNRRTFVLESAPGKALHFIRDANGFHPTEQPNIPFSSKGMGLLQVYTDALQVLPLSSDKTVIQCAQTFATPKSNGVDPNISVQYPLLSSETPLEAIGKDNLIVVDINSDHPIARSLQDYLPIKMDKEGYIYKGIRYEGSYCIMQIFENPYAPGSSLLYIQASDSRQLRRNLFTRQALLPSYVYGLHPYWNNEALIYSNGKYFAVYEWGEDPVEVETQR